MDQRAASLRQVSLEEFQAEVLEASFERPVLVDFWADWCAPCLVLAPLLERVAAEHAGELLVAKVEVDEGENMKLAGRYRLRGFPTVILFRAGEERGRFSGARSYQQILHFLAEHEVRAGGRASLHQ